MYVGTLFTLALAGLAAALPLNQKRGYPDFDNSGYNYCQAPLPTPYNPVPDHELLKVVLFIRHGDRTSIWNLPYDKQVWNLCNHDFDTTIYYNTSSVAGSNRTVAIQEHIDRPHDQDSYRYAMPRGNCITGQLTDKGKDQHNRLGEALRSIYVDQTKFLPEKLDTSQMYVRSTDVWRTRQSAHSLLEGMYPNGSRSDAVIIHTFPDELNNLSGNNRACPAMDKYEALAKQEPEWQRIWNENLPRLQKLNKMLGTENIPKFSSAWSVFNDIFATRICHGFPLPCNPNNTQECVTQEDADVAMKMAFLEYTYIRRDSANHKEYDMANLGSFMSTLADELEVPTVPFSFFSAHDDTLATLLGILQAKDFNWPPYASNMMFEVWQNTTNIPEKVVRVLFNGKVVEPKEGIPCQDLSACPLDQFVGYLRTYIPENLQQFCEYVPTHA